MELYHNQVTRWQGSFSLPMVPPLLRLMMIQQNISATGTPLDFPTLERFERELLSQNYDIVRISGLFPTLAMCVRCAVACVSLASFVIVVGGHLAGIPGIETMIAADHIVPGEGIAWMRAFLGKDPNPPIVHPRSCPASAFRILGMKVPDTARDTFATIVPSVAAPWAATSEPERTTPTVTAD